MTSETGQSPAERFFRYFQHEITALQDQMGHLGDTALVGGERKDATDHCLAGITRLSSEVKDMSTSLPAYDMRTYSDAIKALQEKLAETQAQHAPKPKFSFKTKKNDSAVSLNDVAELAAQKQKSVLNFSNNSNASSVATTPLRQSSPVDKQSSSSGKGTSSLTRESNTPPDEQSDKSTQQSKPSTTSPDSTISSKSNEHIILSATATRNHITCTISSVDYCCVDLSIPALNTASYASLTVTDVTSSLLLCGSIAGPAHITGVKNSTIMTSCRQLRMHDCENVDIYLYCTSRPIIEDCVGLRFAELPTFYTDLLHSATALSNGAIGTNMWESVDDFKWLKSAQSPHWMILPSQERVSDDVWKHIVPGKPGMRLSAILDAVSIKKS